MQHITLIFLVLVLFRTPIAADFDLENDLSDCVLEMIKIDIPGYPHAFNPSIVRWKGSLLIYFRTLSEHKFPNRSEVGFAWLNEDFTVRGKPKILKGQIDDFTKTGVVTSRAEDGRLIVHHDRLYLVYNDLLLQTGKTRHARIHCTEIRFDGVNFTSHNIVRFDDFEGNNKHVVEKNWAPFSYGDHLLFIYKINPHTIFCPRSKNKCTTIAATIHDSTWLWGDLRGGTPAYKIDDHRYLTFFHSVIKMTSLYSTDTPTPHYFVGAYTFSAQKPFEITEISQKPIIGKGFYSGEFYDWYWKPVVAIYPSGFIFDDDFFWVSCGRQDHEAWIVKIDRKRLLDSLAPVEAEEKLN